jgi:hypothetical protein
MNKILLLIFLPNILFSQVVNVVLKKELKKKEDETNLLAIIAGFFLYVSIINLK